MAVEQSTTLSVHNMVLDVETRTLAGPRGHVQLAPQLFALAERLFRRPCAVINHDSLASAVWPDPDGEPEFSDVQLRVRIGQLRNALIVLSGERVRIRSDRGVGWALEVV